MFRVKLCLFWLFWAVANLPVRFACWHVEDWTVGYTSHFPFHTRQYTSFIRASPSCGVESDRQQSINWLITLYLYEERRYLTFLVWVRLISPANISRLALTSALTQLASLSRSVLAAETLSLHIYCIHHSIHLMFCNSLSTFTFNLI